MTTLLILIIIILIGFVISQYSRNQQHERHNEIRREKSETTSQLFLNAKKVIDFYLRIGKMDDSYIMEDVVIKVPLEDSLITLYFKYKNALIVEVEIEKENFSRVQRTAWFNTSEELGENAIKTINTTIDIVKEDQILRNLNELEFTKMGEKIVQTNNYVKLKAFYSRQLHLMTINNPEASEKIKELKKVASEKIKEFDEQIFGTIH